MEKVSIIIPVYNAALYLRKCVESSLRQTYQNIEIILINDGSQDSSLQICLEYAQNDSRVKVIDIPNGGVSNARNIGIEHATGSFLMFVDADDWLAEDAIDKCSPYMAENEIIRFSAIAVYPNRTKKYKLDKSSGKTKIIGDIIARKTVVACWGALFSKNLFVHPESRFDTSLNIGEDWLMTLRLALRCKKMRFLPNLYGYYYNKTNESSCTLTLNHTKILTQFKALSMIREHVPYGCNSKFALSKCLFIQELIDKCGMAEAGRLLHSIGTDFTRSELMYALSANISIRKKLSLLRFYIGKYTSIIS